MEARAYGNPIRPRQISITVTPDEASLIKKVRETPYGEVTAKIKDGVMVLFVITKTEYPDEAGGMELSENIVD